MTVFRAIWIVTAVLAITALVLPFHALAMAFRVPLRKRSARFWHRMVARAMGMRITVIGHPHTCDEYGTLYASNHISWVDIIVLGSIMPVHFIAKGEVKSWPVFGWLARLQDTVFVERERRSTAGAQANVIRERLAIGDNLVLFPEGTTSDGNFAYPFKSSLFGAVATHKTGEHIPVQPVAIAYTGLRGMPMGRRWRPVASWPGTITMGEHLPRVLREGVFDVQVRFGDVIEDAQMRDRKSLCADVECSVRQMLASGLRGEPVPSNARPKALSAAK
ncbi:MAG: lysophospholipid acyltransferase family protein [Pseudomonadota bacterium]